MTLRAHASAACLYAALTVLMTWPLASRLRLMEAGDSSYFAWVVAWTHHALLSDPASLPHANALHPLRCALFLDEPIVGTSLLALPFRLFTDDPILILNLLRLLTFLLTALGVRALGLALGMSPVAAFVTGALFSFASNRVSTPAHLSVLGTQFLPIYFLFLHRWALDARARSAALAGFFFGLSAWACGYHAVLAAAVLPIPILVLVRAGRGWRTAPVGILAALALLVPLRTLHERALEPLRFERTQSETAFFSAPLEALFSTSASNVLWGRATENLRTVVEADLFPGLAVLLLAGFALTGLRDRQAEAHRAIAVYATLALCAWLVMLGPEIRWSGGALIPGPFAALRELDLFRMIRVPARASVFVTLGLAVLAGFGLDRIRKPALRGLVIAIALAETVSAPLPVVSEDRCLRREDLDSPVSAWLQAQEGRDPVIELPILPNDGLFQRPKFDDSVYLLRSTSHWRPLVNGYAGTEPVDYARTREIMREFPSEEAAAFLRSRHVRYVILHLRGHGPNRRQAIEESLPRYRADLAEVARFGDDIILEVIPAGVRTAERRSSY